MCVSSDTDQLLCRAADGDAAAQAELLDQHREQLKRMIAVRMDPRLAARLDPSDVVQETLMAATQRLPDYLLDRPVAFYPWLRRLAFERLVELHRHHFVAQKRSVVREATPPVLPDQSSIALADQVIDSGTSPIRRLVRAELRDRIRRAIDTLSEKYREILILKHLEQLTTDETAEVLGVSASTIKTRYYRALQFLTDELDHQERAMSSST